MWGCSDYLVSVLKCGSEGQSQVKIRIVAVEILAGDVV